uniref:Uncharacterized protein n=1 Tax=Zea mays TaxID=4577 RepID=C4IYP7_MAIZE|nr:unknown [Zea mays]
MHGSFKLDKLANSPAPPDTRTCMRLETTTRCSIDLVGTVLSEKCIAAAIRPLFTLRTATTLMCCGRTRSRPSSRRPWQVGVSFFL